MVEDTAPLATVRSRGGAVQPHQIWAGAATREEEKRGREVSARGWWELARNVGRLVAVKPFL
jgi:hypothetical protein